MNSQPIAEVVGIIKQSERRLPPPRRLRIDTEAPPRRISQTAHPFFAVLLVAPRRHRKNSCHGSFAISQQQHLPIEINFNVLITRVFCLRPARTHDRIEVLAAKLASSFTPFPFLKSD